LSSAKVWKGSTSQLPVGINEDLFITIPRNQYKNLDAAIQLNSQITAPITKGQKLGEVIVQLSGNELIRQPLVALQSVAEGGFFSRMMDNVMMMLE
ncbi:MAG: serine-type D-Ala-D-Ala carboxypeptidase, partial [Gammaproteobacteria bacterium]|nr:serine-type D-Ala-D-Ala carboxypeptidase [Gammaproteobacteria bacterium]